MAKPDTPPKDKDITPKKAKSLWRYGLAFIRHLTSWVLTLGLLLLVLASGLVIALQAEKGLSVLEDAVAVISARAGVPVTVDVQKVTAHHIVIAAVDVADSTGVFLQLRGIDLQINPATYFIWAPMVESLVIDTVDVQRLPVFEETEASSEPFSMPDLRADIKQFDIRSIRTGPDVYGAEQFFTLASRLKLSTTLSENDIAIALAVRDAQQASPTEVNVSFKVDENDHMQLNAVLRDAAGGMVTKLAGLPAGYDVDLKVSATGAADNWTGQIDMRLGDMLKGVIGLQQKEKRLGWTADLTGPKGIFVKGQGAVPVTVEPPDLRLGDEMSGTLETSLNLQTLSVLLGLDDHRLTGKLAVKAVIAGTPRTPDITGTATLRGGSYENISAGLKLTQLNADIAATQTQVNVTSLTARTGRDGKVNATAQVSLKDITQPAYTFAVNLDHAQVMNLQNMEARITGALNGAGDASGLDVTGDLTINGAEIYLAGFGSGSAASMLNIHEINVPKHLCRSRPDKGASAIPFRLGLDVMVKAARNIFVRAQGLESEWSADLHVTGTAVEPQLIGYLKLLRGHYEIFDARLTLNSGKITFSGAAVDNPDLDIKASVKGKEVTATIAVTGTAAAPKVDLTSTPALPQDEILAKVLFDKSVSDLTPMQLVRIAQIIGVMSGRLSAGPDPISQLRKKAGIDTLNVNRDDKTGATSVSIGKQLSGGVYISVDQGINTQGSAVKLEIEVTPNIQVETRIGNDAENSVGVSWKKDY